MFSNLFLLLAVLQFTYVYVYADVIETEINVNRDCLNVSDCGVLAPIDNDREIQHEILTKMCTSTQGLWNKIPENENIQFFPILETIRDNMMLIQIYYENGLAPFYSKNEFLQVPFKLASLLDELKKSSFITVKFKSAMFFHGPLRRGYLRDIVDYFHSECYSAFGLNDQLIEKAEDLIISWMSENVKGRTPKNENLYTSGLKNYHTNVLEFSACWNTNKEVINDALPFHLDHHRKPKFGNETNLYVKTFNHKEIIGYYNNSRKGYEAIKVPYKDTDFIMAILLPYEEQNLTIFLNFTREDYLELLNGINEQREYIDYTIPVLNLPMVKIDEKGTFINPDKPVSCASSERKSSAKLDPKQFLVNGPFGIIIYHEKTKFVLWQALIRDPTSYVYRPGRFLYHTTELGMEFESRFIF